MAPNNLLGAFSFWRGEYGRVFLGLRVRWAVSSERRYKENVTVTDNSVMNTLYDRYYSQSENEYLDKIEEGAEVVYDVKDETDKEE